MRQATASAPANIAFIKYWGARDLVRALPSNPSLSMTLSACKTRTTARVHDDNGPDSIRILRPDGSSAPAPDVFQRRFEAHLGVLRNRMGGFGRIEALTQNTFPSDAGIASSASGFCALALAVSAATGDAPDPAELSVRARLSGSGSATRSALGGYVAWPPPDDPEGAAYSVATPGHWALRDVIAIVEAGPKSVSSLDGHARVATSPHFPRRLELLPDRFARTQRAIDDRDFSSLASLLEEEAIELHLVAMSSQPPIIYWNSGTLDVIHKTRALQADGVPCAFTMDAGANVHVICPDHAEDAVAVALEDLASVIRVIRDGVGTGPTVEDGSIAQ